MLINKPYLQLYIFARGNKLPLTFNNFLFYTFADLFISTYYKLNTSENINLHKNKLNNKKNLFKLFYVPVKANLAVLKQSKFFYNPLGNMFFKQEFSVNTSKLFMLFYNLGYSNKKIIFFSFKGELVSISTLLTHLIFSNNYATFIFKVLYILTRKKIKTKKKKLKRILSRLKAYAIFFLDLPKSRKFITYLKQTSLLTVGLTNSNLFDLNVPVANNWTSHKLMYALQVYDYYRLGANSKKLYLLKFTIFKLHILSSIFFKR